MKVLKKDINIFDSLECGQIFRFKKLDEKTYYVVSKDNYATIKDFGEYYEIQTSNDKYFQNFFNLDIDYKQILGELKNNKYLKDIIPQDNVPLRILNQDPFEMIISFIVSANNNIPRIKGIISKMCEGCGKMLDNGDHAFPSADNLAKRDVKYFESIGLGYRAPYILKTAKDIASGAFDYNELYSISTEDARKKLIALSGVGPKVADCILLFGYNRYDVFPVDTWIKKVYQDLFKKDNTPENMRRDFIKEFGKYSGIAQQYLFYKKRSNKDWLTRGWKASFFMIQFLYGGIMKKYFLLLVLIIVFLLTFTLVACKDNADDGEDVINPDAPINPDPEPEVDPDAAYKVDKAAWEALFDGNNTSYSNCKAITTNNEDLTATIQTLNNNFKTTLTTGDYTYVMFETKDGENYYEYLPSFNQDIYVKQQTVGIMHLIAGLLPEHKDEYDNLTFDATQKAYRIEDDYGSGTKAIYKYFIENNKIVKLSVVNKSSKDEMARIDYTYGEENVVLPQNVYEAESYYKYEIAYKMVETQPGTFDIAGFDLSVGAKSNEALPASITIKGFVGEVGSFYNHSEITNVTIENGVNTIGTNAFTSTGITTIDLPNSVTSIGGHAFSSTGITTIDLPNSVTSIGMYAFSDCTSLTTADLSSNLEEVGSGVFSSCTILSSVTNLGKITEISNGMFTYCSALTTVALPSTVTNIGDMAFMAAGLQSITLPGSITKVGTMSFLSCTALTNISFLGSTTDWANVTKGDLYNLSAGTTTIHCEGGDTTF